ncbi:hypothetical protein [Arthrobacter sp. CAN_A1]|uniref:hypothetical protein n=1 Tax=Arthrobacter sp. CAN_A1 TaxID=2787717 RepID=UPI0018CAFC42
MLIERTVNFAHGYRVKCPSCSTEQWLTAEEYAANAAAGSTCSNCHGAIDLGPSSIALRNPNDLALCDRAVSRLAWYHTTDQFDWPASEKPLETSVVEHFLERVRMSDEELDAYRLIHENQALHIGTYEAALESMLRRMREQDAQDQQFYLFRVGLREGLEIESCWRDENTSPAAKITSADLIDQGIDAIRYLNAHESVGSISMAVLRGGIESVQKLALPVRELELPSNLSVIKQLREIRKEISIILEEHEKSKFERADQERKRIEAWGGRELTRVEAMKRKMWEIQSPPPIPKEASEALMRMRGVVAFNYIKDLPTVSKNNFLLSLHGPSIHGTEDGDVIWLEKFMGLAALLTQHQQVRRTLFCQPWRAV